MSRDIPHHTSRPAAARGPTLRPALHSPKRRFKIRHLSVESSTQPQNLERFRQLVLADRALHDQLRATPNDRPLLNSPSGWPPNTDVN